MSEKPQYNPGSERSRGHEGEKKINWHLTETKSGQWSVGTTADSVGHYVEDRSGALAKVHVAPGDFVERYVKNFGGGKFTDDAVREAVRAWVSRDRQS